MENLNQNQDSTRVSANVSIFERIANSVILKMVTIFFLILIMLIPMNLIQDLVSERKQREEEVTNEIAAKWGRDQVITSPVLAVPYMTKVEVVKQDNKGKEYVVESDVEEWTYLLPEKDKVTTSVTPEYLKRGIYQSVVYNSVTAIEGSYAGFDLSKLPVQVSAMQWSKAKLLLGVQDLKGILSNPKLTLQDSTFEFQKDANGFQLFPNVLSVDLNLKSEVSTKFSFKLNLELRGSKSLNILPLANQTEILAKGTWANPSFNGGFLPEDRAVSDTTFEAQWSIPSFARKAPQQWHGENSRIYDFSGLSLAEYASADYPIVATESANAASASENSTMRTATDVDMVQVNFLPDVNNYQKANRATKYGILIIILTFVSLFFTEIIKKERVHLIQYILIGAAMTLFYSLLLAFSEHFGFNWAYLIAGIATIVLISSFIKAITKNGKTALLFAGILGLFYTFIYVLMQLRDYSLIVGTIGVFIILAVLMRLSTKINWYQFDRK